MKQLTRHFSRSMGRWLMALMLVMFSSLAAKAAEAYACYTPSNTTLTFYYDNQRSSRPGTTYDLNTGSGMPKWYLDHVHTDVTKVVFDPSFASARPTTTIYWFYYMQQLTSITGLCYLNTSEVTNMKNMFSGCYALTSLDLSNFNTANVTDMQYMFYSCNALTSLDLSSFNTANVTNMHFMFVHCTGLTSLDLSSFNTANVTMMQHMFWNCSGLTSLDLSSFNTSKVMNMYGMFWGCSALTSLDLSHFNTAKVTDMHYLFYDCSALTNLDVSHFNTANVTDTHYMFNGCSSLTSLDLSSFNTANVTKMEYMFNNSSNLRTIYVGDGWSTAAVTASNKMFFGCNSLVGGQGTTFDANHINAEYAHIDGGPSNPGYFTEKCLEAYACYTPSNTTLTFYYDFERASRPGTIYDLNTGVDNPEWRIDGTYANVTKVVFDPSFIGARPSSTHGWFDEMRHLNSITGTEYLNTRNVYSMGNMFHNCTSLTSLDVSRLNTRAAQIMASMFEGCESLTSLDLSNFNTNNVYDMRLMFSNCLNLETIIVSSKWNTFYTDYSGNMFLNCASLVGGQGTTYDPNHVDKSYAHIDGGPSNPGYLTVGKEAYACYVQIPKTLTFYYDDQRSSRTGTKYDLNYDNEDPVWPSSAKQVSIDPSFADYRPQTTYHWFKGMSNIQSITGINYLNTSMVENMSGMFITCTSLTSLDVSHFNTANVRDMSDMFSYCTHLTSLDVSHFNTANVTDMHNMFNYCIGLTSLDLGSFSTSKVTDMSKMFYNCGNLTTIYAGSGWTTDAVTNSYDMFQDCTSLVGGMGTTYDANHTDKTYAHIDLGSSNPGYFTEKPSFTRGDVNGDSNVSITDVTTLINYLLSGDATGVNLEAADCDQNGQIKIGDVTALINYLLSGQW